MDERWIKDKKIHIFWIGFISVLTCIYFLYISAVELCSDEAYYWDWSRHLSMGYYDHPPMVAYLISLFTSIVGQNATGVRLGAVFCAVGTLIMVYLTAKNMFHNEWTGIIASLLLSITPGFMINAVIITPDAPLLFLWTTGVYFTHLAITSSAKRFWLMAGLVIGLGLMSKYTMVFLPIAIFFFMLTSARDATSSKRGPYIALLVAIIVFSPVIYWNATHDWVSFNMQLAHGFCQNRQIEILSFVSFVGSQAGLLSPLLFILCLVSIFVVGYKGFRQKRSELLLLFWSTVLPLIFFLFLSLQAKCEGNWPAPAYITGFIAMAYVIQQGLQKYRDRGYIKCTIFIGAGLSILFTTLIVIHSFRPILPIPSNKDTTNRLYGWKKLGTEVTYLLSEMNNRPFLLAENYHIGSELKFYGPHNYEVYSVNGKKRYHYWKDLEMLIGRDALFVTDKEGIEHILIGFQSFNGPKLLNIYRNGYVIRKLYLWQCYNYKGGVL